MNGSQQVNRSFIGTQIQPPTPFDPGQLGPDKITRTWCAADVPNARLMGMIMVGRRRLSCPWNGSSSWGMGMGSGSGIGDGDEGTLIASRLAQLCKTIW